MAKVALINLGFLLKEKEKEKQQQQEDPSGPCVSAGEGMKDVPIFTEEFLALNKARETELKQLRKSVTEMEEQARIWIEFSSRSAILGKVFIALSFVLARLILFILHGFKVLLI